MDELGAAERTQLARPIATFQKAHEAYANAAAEASRLRREAQALTARIDLDQAGELDSNAKNAATAAAEVMKQEGLVPPRRHARPSATVIAAIRHARQAQEADEKIWAPLARITASHRAARAKRKAIVGLWEAAFRQITSLIEERASSRHR